MYMRMVHVKLKGDALAKVEHLYNDRIIPALATVPGCRYAGLMQSAQHPDECSSLTFWDDKESAEAYEKSGLFSILLDETRPFLINSSESRIQLSEDLTLEYVPIPEEPVVTAFPVAAMGSAQGRQREQQGAVWVRLVSLKVRPGKKEEFQRKYEEEVIPALRNVKGCRHVYLTERPDRQDEVISVTSWDSRQDAEAYEKGGLFAELLGRQKSVLSDLYQWKMQSQKEQGRYVATSDDVVIEQFHVVAGRSYP